MIEWIILFFIIGLILGVIIGMVKMGLYHKKKYYMVLRDYKYGRIQINS